MSKGSIYIVNLQKSDLIYTRLTLSRAGVNNIHYHSESKLFFSTCLDNILKVSFSHLFKGMEYKQNIQANAYILSSQHFPTFEILY